jgi:hypothetical protein
MTEAKQPDPLIHRHMEAGERELVVGVIELPGLSDAHRW